MRVLADVRRADEIGKRARVVLAFADSGGLTTLATAYAESPFRIGPWFREDGGAAHVIVTSSAPGIFGGDSWQQTVSVADGACARITSQSALQVHASATRACAEITSVYRVDAGGRLICEWDPVIPFPGSRLNQIVHIDLAKGARLFWSDAGMCGREARGERWLFDAIGHQLRVTRDGVLVYLERYRIEPRAQDVSRRWVMHDATYFGTVLSAGVALDPLAVGGLHERLNAEPGIRAAVDVVEGDVAVVRVLATSGSAFRRARHLAGPESAVWLGGDAHDRVARA